MEVTPAAGYKLIGFATPATDENFVTYENGVATLDTASYIRKIGENAEADNIAVLSVVANLEPETYKIAIQSNRADCATAAAVKNNAGVILHDGDDISYHRLRSSICTFPHKRAYPPHNSRIFNPKRNDLVDVFNRSKYPAFCDGAVYGA